MHIRKIDVLLKVHEIYYNLYIIESTFQEQHFDHFIINFG